jgi:hypothetical protein
LRSAFGEALATRIVALPSAVIARRYSFEPEDKKRAANQR